MTLREFDLYVKGRAQHDDRQMEKIAWHAANLMNVQIAKGPKMTVEKLLPRTKKNKPLAELPPENLEEAKARVRAVRDAKDEESFWGDEGSGLTRWLDG